MNEQIFSIPSDLVRGPSADVLPLAGEANWGIKKFGIENLRQLVGDNKIKIGVVDTGIDESHPLLRQNFVAAKDFTGSSIGFRDRNGHGTHCSGTVGASDPRIGMFPNVELYHGKGLSDSGSGSMGNLLAAMEWCFAQGCEIVSCSWGGGTSVDLGTDRQLREWAERGLWCIFASGNSGASTPQTEAPGNSLHAFNVAAADENLNVAPFSSSGSKLDTTGPGVRIWSARPGGGVQEMSGSSMATPGFAGAAGLYRTALKIRNLPIPNVYQLRVEMRNDAIDIDAPGVDRRSGPGAFSTLLMRMNLTPLPKVG